MKNILIITFPIFVLGLPGLITAQATDQEWYKLESPTNKTLKKLTFVDNVNGWAAGDSGTIIRTTDGGDNWVIQNSTVKTSISDIFFLNEHFGWAITRENETYNSVILKTTDGGENWFTEYFPNTTAFLYTIFFQDTLNGFVGGNSLGGSNIAYTTDGGNNWLETEVDSFSNWSVNHFDFYNRQFGYACGGEYKSGGVVFRTTNSGLNWRGKRVPGTDGILDIFIFDSLNAHAFSCSHDPFFPMEKLQTRDAGKSWQNEKIKYSGWSFALDFRGAFEGWSAGGLKFLFTSDRGRTWIERDTPDSSFIYDLQFTDPQTGYACGKEGVILKYGSQNPLSVDNALVNLNEFELSQNYPNPFNPSTTIKYSVPKSGFVKLSVYNLVGEEVNVLVNELVAAGFYEVTFNSAYLPSGIYFYRLQTDRSIQTKKMVLLK